MDTDDIEKQPSPQAQTTGTGTSQSSFKAKAKIPGIEPDVSEHPIPTASTDISSSNDYAPRVRADKLARSLSPRQVQMIAIGGTIGTGLFLGTGKSLATGGPASMLISYAICGGIVFVTMLCLGEMAAFVPVAGSFCTFAG